MADRIKHKVRMKGLHQYVQVQSVDEETYGQYELDPTDITNTSYYDTELKIWFCKFCRSEDHPVLMFDKNGNIILSDGRIYDGR